MYVCMIHTHTHTHTQDLLRELCPGGVELDAVTEETVCHSLLVQMLKSTGDLQELSMKWCVCVYVCVCVCVYVIN